MFMRKTSKSKADAVYDNLHMTILSLLYKKAEMLVPSHTWTESYYLDLHMCTKKHQCFDCQIHFTLYGHMLERSIIPCPISGTDSISVTSANTAIMQV